jgi:putative serine protease PepD
VTERAWDFESTRHPITPPVHLGSPASGVPVVTGPPTVEMGTGRTIEGPRLLGPVSPPGAVSPPPRWGWRALAAFLAGGLLTALGFGAAQLGDDRDGVEVIASGRDGATVATALGADGGTDPAAAVAAMLGPSVVQIETDIGLGSGVVYDDGLILTNHHVIDGASAVRVRLSDRRTLPAEVVGSDPRTDVAVVSVGEGRGLLRADLAVGVPVRVGELTIAIGSPFDLQQTVTSGIISAVNRPIFNGTGWNAMVQTDAAINPGNSGGALANRQGQVIGINTAIQTDGQSSTNAGIGFAMPITTVVNVAERIVTGESLEPAFLGVRGVPPSDGSVWVQIESVEPASAAEAAGFEVGDIVLSLDDAPVTSFNQLAGLIQTSFPGESVMIEFVRNGERIVVDVTLGQR